MKTLLTLYDFSPAGDTALKFAADFGKYTGLEVKALHVLEIPDTIGVSGIRNHPFYKSVPAELDSATSKVSQEAGHEVTGLIKEGALFDTISATANEEQATFVVMPTHGVQGIQNISGSFAGRVVGALSCPTFVLQEKSAFNYFQTLIVPVLSESEFESLEKGIKMISENFRVEVIITTTGAFEKNATSSAQNYLETIPGKLDAHGISARVVKTNGEGEEFLRYLCDTAKSKPGPLIMSKTHKEGNKFPIGKFAQSLITNEQHLPVLLLPA